MRCTGWIPRLTAGRLILVVALADILSAPQLGHADDALWALLKTGEQVVMMRHATAPGPNDRADFRLDDCSTQRNLDERGREEARKIGAAFRARNIPVGAVRSSQWCRCLETARLAFGRVDPWPPLNSIFNDRSREPLVTPEVRALAGRRPDGGNLVLVTHNVNIQAVTGISTLSGEMVILTPQPDGMFTVAGRLPPSKL